MTNNLAIPPESKDLSDLISGLTTTLEVLGWANKTRTNGVTRWQVNNANLLPGLREAARRSLAEVGVADPDPEIDSVVSVYQGNEFLAYRSLLSERALIALADQFSKRFGEGVA